MAAAKPDGPPPTIATSTSSSYRVHTSSSSTISLHLKIIMNFQVRCDPVSLFDQGGARALQSEVKFEAEI